MAKRSMIERDIKRKNLQKKYANKYKKLKEIVSDRSLPIEDRFQAQLELAGLPRNSSKVRYRNRCDATGRPRGYYRKFKLCRIVVRDLASIGQLPGVVKSSW